MVLVIRKQRVHLALACWEKLATLILTNTYFVGLPSQATVTVQDSDSAANIVAVASLNAPVGIDYHTNSNSLIVSVNVSQQSVGGVAPLHAARTSQRDVPTTLNTYTPWEKATGFH